MTGGRRFFTRPPPPPLPGAPPAPSAPHRPARVAVIGGGLAGLAAAHRLCRSGIRTTVYEAAPRTGGVITSVTSPGGAWTHDAGANSMAAKHAPVHELIVRELGMAEAVTPRLPGAGGVLISTPGGGVARLPSSLGGAIMTPLLSPWGKLRALAEPLIPAAPRGGDGKGGGGGGGGRRPPPESVHAFATRRFGAEVADRVVDAGVAGIYSASSKVLAVEHALPSLAEAERRSGSVLVGMVTAGRAAKRAAAATASASAAAAGGEAGEASPAAGTAADASGGGGATASAAAPPPSRKALRSSFNFVGGMAALPRALAASVCASPAGCAIRTSTRVVSVERTRQGTWVLNGRTGGGAEVDALVLAVPAYALPGLVSRHGGGGGGRWGPLGAFYRRPTGGGTAATPPVLRSALNRLATTTRYSPVTVMALGYDRADVAHPLDAFGVLVPAAAPVSAGSPLLGVNFTSSTYGGRAPDGSVLLTAYAGGDRGTVRSTDAVKRDVRALVGVAPPAAGAPPPERYEHVTRWPRGIPIMGPWCGTVNAVAAAAEAALPGVRFAGNWRGGVGVPDALAGGLAAADAVAAWLHRGGGTA